MHLRDGEWNSDGFQTGTAPEIASINLLQFLDTTRNGDASQVFASLERHLAYVGDALGKTYGREIETIVEGHSPDSLDCGWQDDRSSSRFGTTQNRGDLFVVEKAINALENRIHRIHANRPERWAGINRIAEMKDKG